MPVNEMAQLTFKWVQILIGTAALIWSLVMIIRDIALGIAQRRKIKNLGTEDTHRIYLASNLSGYLKVAPIGVIIFAICLELWRDYSLGTVGLLFIPLLLLSIWLLFLPNIAVVRLSGDGVTMVKVRLTKIDRIISERKTELDTLQIEFGVPTGGKISLECDLTENNIQVIDLIRNRISAAD